METFTCSYCRRVLAPLRGGDGAVVASACRTTECVRRRIARTTRVGCWAAEWRHPEEIAAVSRLHDRVCECRAAREKRGQI